VRPKDIGRTLEGSSSKEIGCRRTWSNQLFSYSDFDLLRAIKSYGLELEFDPSNIL